MPSISCPHCKQPLTVNPLLAGQIVNCPACNQRVRLPATIPAGPPAPAMPLPSALPPPAPAAIPIPTSVGLPPSMSRPFPQPLPPSMPLPPAAAPFPAPLPKDSSASLEVDTSARGIPFRAREYPALRVVMYVLYSFAILTACSFIISEILLIAGSTYGLFSSATDSDAADSLRRSSTPSLAAGGIVAFLLAQAITIGYHAIAALWFVASAEMIRVLLDVQNNTHEAAHYVRQSFDRRR